jgi:hypothetical protein
MIPSELGLLRLILGMAAVPWPSSSRISGKPRGKSGTREPQKQRMWALALVAFLIPLPLPRMAPAPMAGPGGSCWPASRPDLDGLYVLGRREVVVCPRGEPSTTLRHEGWHLVRNLCLGGRTWLSPQTVETHLSRRDREELALLVQPERRFWEAEARVMAKVQPGSYVQEVDRACAP